MRFVTAILTCLFAYANVHGQTVPIIQLQHLNERLEKGGDTTFVVNFWATWCSPCVKELPFFENLQAERKTERFKVLLVTLDFVENLDTRVIPFIAKKEIRSEVLLLDEANPNKWIPEVSEEWSGAIPATLFINKKTRHFHEGSFHSGELEQKLQEIGL